MTPVFRSIFHSLFKTSKKPLFLFLPLFLAVVFSPKMAYAEPVKFIFSSDMPAQQKHTVQGDLAVLNQLRFRDTNGKGARLFGIPLNSENLKKWLTDRSRYIVSETFSYNASVKVMIPNFSYPNADFMPYLEVTPSPQRNGEISRVVTIMTNMGAHIYHQGKRAKNLLAADLAGIGNVTITSPRIGLFKVGEGLFVPLLKNETENYISFANSLRRLAVYFHEARHSDGNGKSLGFLHAPCPSDKGTFAGRYACDRNQNGPYTIEGIFLRSTVDNCRDCSRKEKEALRNIYADKFSRVITAGTYQASASQRVPADSLKDTCRSLAVLNVRADLAAACKAAAGSTTSPGAVKAPELRPAWLDERPEGIH